MQICIVTGALVLILAAISVFTGQSRVCPDMMAAPVIGCPHLYGSLG